MVIPARFKLASYRLTGRSTAYYTADNSQPPVIPYRAEISIITARILFEPAARESSYSFPIRANINYLLGYSVKHYFPYLEMCDRLNDSHDGLLDKAFTILINRRYSDSGIVLKKKDEQLLQAFWLLISLRTNRSALSLSMHYSLNTPKTASQVYI